MTITLKDITKDNWREAIRLGVGPGQEHFVATNVVSIAESKFYPSFVPTAIYDDEKMVGFLMHGQDDKGCHWIIRLMVDAQYQGRGYGRVALVEVIHQLRADPGLKEIAISYEPDNKAAQKLYASLGFVETGEIEEGETVARLKFDQ